MNSEIAKKVIGYTLGALAGAGLGYVVTTFVLDNFMEEEEEIIWEDEEIKDIEEEQEQPSADIREHMKKGKKKLVDYAGISKNQKNPDLLALAERYRNGDPEEGEKAADISEEVEEQTIDRSKPYFITSLEFTDEMMSQQKMYLNLYEEDDVLTDAEDNSIIANPAEQFLGSDWLDGFGKDEREPDTIHIRNEAIGADYEITMIHGSYEATVTNVKTKKKKDKPKVVKVEKHEKEVDDEED